VPDLAGALGECIDQRITLSGGEDHEPDAPFLVAEVVELGAEVVRHAGAGGEQEADGHADGLRPLDDCPVADLPIEQGHDAVREVLSRGLHGGDLAEVPRVDREGEAGLEQGAQAVVEVVVAHRLHPLFRALETSVPGPVEHAWPIGGWRRSAGPWTRTGFYD